MNANEWLSNLIEQIRALPPGRRVALGATAAGTLGFLLWLTLGMGAGDERLLYRDLAEDEAAPVVEALEAEKIPYRLAEGGSAIYVPAPQVHEARIRVAARGLPAGGGTGFEIFDRSGFGVTEFVNRVNYQRALQGELARSVEQLEAVERARVQVAVPERKGFVASRSRHPSAAVVVRMRPGHELEPAQVRGIVHLVASSVEGLDSSRVTVVDGRGRLLAPTAQSDEVAAPAGALGHQARLERQLAQRIESILEPTVGPDRVVARVRADLDWTRVESTEERFDPDSQVARSEVLEEETATDGVGVAAGGVPGAGSNLPGLAGPEPAPAGSTSTRKTETLNYEISKKVVRTVGSVGSVRRLDVAVLVDGKPAETADAPFTPWEEESLRSFEELAKRAVGFSQERGDQITVTSAPFESIEIEEPAGGLSPEIVLLVSAALRALGIVVALLLLAKLVVRPLLEKLTVAPPAGLPASAGDLELQLAGAGSAELASGAAEAGAPAAANPAGEEAVKAVRVWLSER